MTALPCDVCGESGVGRLLGFYLTVIVSGSRKSRRLKLCERDIENLVARYGSKWSDGLILNRFGFESKCTDCEMQAHAVGLLHPMYVTAYSAKGTRYDYYAVYCGDCANSLIDTFNLTEIPARAR